MRIYVVFSWLPAPVRSIWRTNAGTVHHKGHLGAAQTSLGHTAFVRSRSSADMALEPMEAEDTIDFGERVRRQLHARGRQVGFELAGLAGADDH